jgi:predicted ABC-type ATPase
LESTSVAIERVKDRVAKGGHSVDEETIQKRFDAGLTMLDENFNVFDLVSIYLSKQRDIEGIVVVEPPRRKVISILLMPASLILKLPNLFQFIEKNR